MTSYTAGQKWVTLTRASFHIYVLIGVKNTVFSLLSQIFWVILSLLRVRLRADYHCAESDSTQTITVQSQSPRRLTLRRVSLRAG